MAFVNKEFGFCHCAILSHLCISFMFANLYHVLICLCTATPFWQTTTADSHLLTQLITYLQDIYPVQHSGLQKSLICEEVFLSL